MVRYTALERIGTGRYYFTMTLDGFATATGYCAPYREWSDEDVRRFQISGREIALRRAHAPKHHSGGHETAEEAARCYRDYLLDHHLRLGVSCAGQFTRCRECGEPTDMIADLDGSAMSLCADHNTREHVEKHTKPSLEIWRS